MNKKIDTFKNLTLISQFGISIFVNVGVGYFIGSWLDSVFYTTPFFMIAFVILFVLSAFWTIYLIAMKSVKKTDKDYRKRG